MFDYEGSRSEFWMVGMKRRTRIAALLTSIATWAGVLALIGFGCVVAGAVALHYGYGGPGVLIAMTDLPTVIAGLVSPFAFSLRGAMEAQWRFSLANLLVVTTVIAVMLALFVMMLRGS